MDDERSLDRATREAEEARAERGPPLDGVVIPPMPEEMRRAAMAHERAGFPPGPRDDPAELQRRLRAS